MMASDDSNMIDSDIESYMYSQVYHDFRPDNQCIYIDNASSALSTDSFPAPISVKHCKSDLEHKNTTLNKVSSKLAPSWSTFNSRENMSTLARTQSDIASGLPVWNTFFTGGKENNSKTKDKGSETQENSFISLRPSVKILPDVELQAERANRKKPLVGELHSPFRPILIKKCKVIKNGGAQNKTESSSDSSEVEIMTCSESEKQNVIINLNGSKYSSSNIEIKKQSNSEKQNVVSNLDASTDSLHAFFDNEINVKQGNHRSLWLINREDTVKNSKSKDYRHYLECYNCKEKGHLSKSCTKPKRVDQCYLCGEPGHLAHQCTKPVCSKCLLPGHWERQCRWSVGKAPPCPLCHVKGHLCQECPSIWRRYHLTTSPGPLVTVSEYAFHKSHIPYCCMCGRAGHYGYACTRPRKNKVFPVCRVVHDYRDPRKIIFNKTNTSLWRRRLRIAGVATESEQTVSEFLQEAKKQKTASELKRERKKKKQQIVPANQGSVVKINPNAEVRFPRSKKMLDKPSVQLQSPKSRGKLKKEIWKKLHLTRTVYQNVTVMH